MIGSKKIRYSEFKEEYNALISHLSREQCVLLIGPELLRIQGESFQQTIRAHLSEKFPDKIPFYYQKEALYIFSDGSAKARIQEKIRDKLEAISSLNSGEPKPEEAAYKKIAALPFHLILSVNPDHFLSDVFSKYGVRHRVAFFDHSKPETTDVEEPRNYKPLIYNLFGSKNKDASLVLDYDDLFSLFKNMLGVPGLPRNLRSKLEEAKSFLFLGFRFDRWYSQLLLQILAEKRVINKFVLDENPDPETCIFLANQWGINMLGNDMRFFNLLFRGCKERELLRDLIEINNPHAQQFFQWVQKGDYGQAMQLFGGLFKDTEQQSDAILLQGRYNTWEKNFGLGLQDKNAEQVELNRIMYAALQFVQEKL